MIFLLNLQRAHSDVKKIPSKEISVIALTLQGVGSGLSQLLQSLFSAFAKAALGGLRSRQTLYSSLSILVRHPQVPRKEPD